METRVFLKYFVRGCSHQHAAFAVSEVLSGSYCHGNVNS